MNDLEWTPEVEQTIRSLASAKVWYGFETDILKAALPALLHELDKARAALVDALAEDDDWGLTPRQFLWMIQHNNTVLDALERNDSTTIQRLESSTPYERAFGDMSWDEAWDRYTSILRSG